MSTSKTVTIFEGCDGGGKTTLAKVYAATYHARYVHFNNVPRVTDGLARLYVEAMLPALLGYQDVVLDRCWLSETPYGEVFREGRDRLTLADRAMLERLAMRCGAVVVHCRTSWERTVESFRARKGKEMLKSEQQLAEVYRLYENLASALPVVEHDWQTDDRFNELTIVRSRHDRHPLDVQSAGNLSANYVLVGEAFADLKDQDPFYQWPFGSFSQEGCSQWLTHGLIEKLIPEDDLLWVNADQEDTALKDLINSHERLCVVALGSVAYEKLRDLKIACEVVPHPQWHKRFNSRNRYQLFNLLGGAE